MVDDLIKEHPFCPLRGGGRSFKVVYMMARDILQHETFMHRLVHSLAMVTMLLHMMWGCCWHHAHAECSAHDGQAAIVEGHLSLDLHEHNGCAGHDAAKLHGHYHGCKTGSCTFFIPQVRSQEPVVPDSPCPANAVVATALSADRSSMTPHIDADSLGGLDPQHRPHLLNQVFLL
jgi:hypothetical protein